MRVRVYLFRHGEPEDTGIFYGHRDVGLSARGRAQIEAQVSQMRERGLSRMLASDLQRARLGAEAVASASSASIEVTPSLREMHLGVLEGLRFAEAAARHPELAGRSYADMLDFRMAGGGESVLDVDARVTPAVEAFVHRAGEEGTDTVGVYAHNTVTRILLARAAGIGPGGYIRFKQTFGCISRIDVDHDAMWERAMIAWSNRTPSDERPT